MDEISIEDARPKLGELVDHARIAGQSTVITRHGKPAALLVPVDLITDADRRLAAQARELAGTPPEGNRAYTGLGDDVSAAADALGRAKHLLGELAVIVDRLDGHG